LQEFRPVGARRDVRSAFRFVAATNESLGELVAAGRFRSDLAHRIGAVVIPVPPLVQRREDIRELTQHFLSQASAGVVDVGDDAVRALERHTWPGNIRELRQVVEWASTLGSGRLSERVIELALSQRIASEEHREVVRDEGREYVELRMLLDAHGWDTESAARTLGVHRATLYRRMKRNQLVTPINARRLGHGASPDIVAG
jgi:DNA-binding NtrC family response regulator